MGRARRVTLALTLTLIVAATPASDSLRAPLRTPEGPPWPVVVPTQEGRFVIMPSGRVLEVPAVHPHAPGALPSGAFILDRGRAGG